MSFDGKKNVGDAGIGQPVTSASPPLPTLNGSSDDRPPRLQNLAGLLRRENVEFVLVVGCAKALRISVELADGGTDMKAIAVGDVGGSIDGCFVLLRLSDNPLDVGAGFFELRPAPT